MDTIEDYQLKVDELKLLLESNSWESFAKNPNGMQEILGITHDVLSRYFTVANHFLEEQNWINARDAFLFLTFLNPSIHTFWMGLGIAEQSQGQFEPALVAYLMGEVTDPNDPMVHANAYQCHEALGNRVMAIRSFQIALDSCDSREGYSALKDKLLNYRKQLAMQKQ